MRGGNRIKEKRCIKFYLDESLNKGKKDKVLNFLSECQDAQNQMYKYFWEKFDIIIKCNTKVDINTYVNQMKYRVVEPRLKSHHHQQVLQAVFGNLKTIQSSIIGKMRFKFEDKDEQIKYNYLKGFCFRWHVLEKYVKNQIKKVKDDKYVLFLESIKDLINDKEKYLKIKQEIEDKFYEFKNSQKCPVMKEFQIQCNTHHTIKDIEMKEFQWVFKLDTNTVVGGTVKKAIFDHVFIPVKFSDYHKKKLEGKELAKTFNVKLNKYGRIEIIGVYDIDVDKKEYEITDEIGVDIGLIKLITTSDGEIIDNNKTIIKKLKFQSNKLANRNRLESHIKKKTNDESFRLPKKSFQKQRNALLNFIKCDTRHRIKNFLKDRIGTHIIIEDLNISQSKVWNKEINRLLRRMHIQRIKDYLIDYGEEYGIKVSIVNPAYTSQQCSSCGNLDKASRKSQETFSCVLCGYEINADINAAINIKDRITYKNIKLNSRPDQVREALTS